MTDDNTPKPPAGMSEATVKFEHKHEADAALSALGQAWPRLQEDAYQAQAAEDDVQVALPKWAREIQSKIARLEGPPCEKASQRAIAGLKTPAYLAALSDLEAAEQRTKDRDGALDEVWERILATPALTPAGVLVKLRIGVREIINDYGDNDGRMPEESEIGIYDRMTLAALTDLERLAGADTGPCETSLRQSLATTGHSGMPKGGGEEFLALVEELDDIKDTANNMVPGAAYYVLAERVKELDEEMLETRAGTLAGVVWKLKELTRLLDNQPDISVSDYERRLAHSARKDIAALAGED